MPRPDHTDDDAIDALIAGTPRGEVGAGLTSFIDDLRTAAGAVPTPSPVLAAAIAAGGISTQQPNVAKWRKWRMKIQGFLAGLTVAGKIVLGAGVAAAATTGAGAAGVLPEPVQHAVSAAVGAVTPFSMPDPEHHSAPDGTHGDTTTTVGNVTTTTKHRERPVVTPTTRERHDTTTTVHRDGDGTTPTTKRHGDGERKNYGKIALLCERSADPRFIACSWSASTSPLHVRYVLLRMGGGEGRVLLESTDALHFRDTTVKPGEGYAYKVLSRRADGSVDARSAAFTIRCCGDLPKPTPTTEHHDATTSTTVHDGDGTTTTTDGH